MSSTPIPVLDLRSDALTCDYPSASYRCALTPTSKGVVRVLHELEDAPELAELVSDDAARFAVEVVSKRTFRSRLEQADAGEWSQTFNLDAAGITKAEAQARPGLIAVRDCQLPVEGLGLAWRSLNAPVNVRAGQWLARAQHSELETPQNSLVKFIDAPSIGKTELRCLYVPPYYHIQIHPLTRSECAKNETGAAAKTVTLAAWVTALAHAGTQAVRNGTEPDDHMGQQLKAVLSDLDPDCPAPGEDDYDPLRAATILSGADLITFDDRDD